MKISELIEKLQQFQQNYSEEYGDVDVVVDMGKNFDDDDLRIIDSIEDYDTYLGDSTCVISLG